MNYSAGDLSLNINANNNGAMNSLDQVITRLNRLQTALNSLDVSKITLISSSFREMGDSLRGLDNLKIINSLATRLQNFANKLSSIDWTTALKGIGTLTTAITPFIDKVMTAESALRALNQTLSLVNGRRLQNLSNWSGNVGTGAGGKNKSGGGFFGALGRITTVYFIARRLGSAIAKIAQAGADYTETLNLWETAMTRNLDKATQFVDKMNEAYGISEKTLMNAQATFKNMLGSLGQISEDVAYQLSEGVTQMAVDYASLYNVTFDKAFEKFQSALAGQVRPIRSVSGYDITENTIYELYKQLGGEKSVRNLSRTEKQLLAILAVFNQMQASGAIGDLDKTMESYANQSRVMAEAWSETVSYAGILLTHSLQQSGIIRTITANLMVLSDIFKQVADTYGAIQSFGGDIFESTTESIEETSDAIDELNGKLLDFDKFRTMEDSESSVVAIDEKLLDALSRYESILEDASNIVTVFKALGATIFSIVSISSVVSLFTSITSLFTSLKTIILPIITKFTSELAILKTLGAEAGLSLTATATAIGGVGSKLLAMFLNPITWIVAGVLLLLATSEDFRESISSLLGALMPLVNLVIGLVKQILPPLLGALGSILSFIGSIVSVVVDVVRIGVILVEGMLIPILVVIEAIIKAVSTLLILLETLFSWKWSSLGNRLSSLWSDWSSSKFAETLKGQIDDFTFSAFAEGGLPDKGTMFVAGEAGAEMVYNTPSGQSGVANIQQIAQANYNGTIKALNDWWGGMSAKQDIPKLQGANATGLYQAVTGVAKAQGERWSKY